MSIPTLQAVDAEIARRQAVKNATDFRAYCYATYHGLVPGWHLDVVCEALQWVHDETLAGNSPNLIIEMPPRHTKSTTVSQRLPAWVMAKHGWDVILVSYGQSLANQSSVAARNLTKDPITVRSFPHVAQPPKRKTDFQIDQVETWTCNGPDRMGTFRSAGITAGVVGFGANILIFDDPHKGRAEAESAVERENVWQLWQSTSMTRLAPGGGRILMMQRWHDDDLIGRVQKHAEEKGEKWRVLTLRAIAEEDEYGTDGKLRRRKGEALHPARYSIDRLRQMEAINPIEFAAQYQQRPLPSSGGLIKPEYLKHEYTPTRWVGRVTPRGVHESSPTLCVPDAGNSAAQRILSFDTANKVGELNDFSAIGSYVKIAYTAHLCDVHQKRLEIDELVELAIILATRDNPHRVLIEDKASGTQLIRLLRMDKRWRWTIEPITPSENKVIRMSNQIGWLKAGRLLLCAGAIWRPSFDSECLLFRHNATNDDQVDQMSQALEFMQEPEVSGISAWRSAASTPGAAAIAAIAARTLRA